MVLIEDGAQKRFVSDVLSRSLSCNDWLCDEAFSSLPDITPDLFPSTAQDAMKKVFERCVDVLAMNTKIQTVDSLDSPKIIDFHSHFGWILKRGEHKAYLGKISLLEKTRLIIGPRSYFSGHGTLRGGDKIKIGSFCSIAEGVFANCFRDFHPMTHASTYNFAENRRLKEDGLNIEINYQEFKDAQDGIEIGNDVWIGRNVRIYHGSKIGDGCVIAEGSFVRGELEPFGIYAGRPARLIRYRFDEKIRTQLSELAWWHWPIQKIHENRSFFEAALDSSDLDIRSLLTKGKD